MLMVKIALQLLTGAVALFTVMLEHRWHDRRTNVHKRTFAGLISMLVLTSLLSVTVTILDTRQARMRTQALAEDIHQLTATNSVLVAQVTEISSWGASFRPLTETLVRSVSTQLIAAKKEHGEQALPIRFQCETGSAPRATLGEQLGWLFGAIHAGHYQPGTFSGFRPGASIEVLCPSNSVPYMNAVATVLGTVIDGDIRLNKSGAGRMITVHINGTPMFRVDGRVKFQ